MKQIFDIRIPAVTRYNVAERRREVTRPESIERITVEVDFEKIAQRMGTKAALSKSHKSIDIGGLVVVRARQPKPIKGIA